MCPIPDILTLRSEAPESADITFQNTLLHVTEKERKNEKLNKSNIMPTWAAAKSPLQPRCMKRTNSEVVAPLFKRAPTDYATLYTVLALTQEIAAVIVGP